MNVALRTAMTLSQFLAWEQRQEFRYEFDGFQPVAMNGGTAAHAVIGRNLIVSLAIHLRGKPCQPYGSTMKIEVAGRIRYPDAFVVCTPVPPRSTVVADPVIVLEVLSNSTANTDMVLKNAEYRATLSIKRYVVLQQTHAGATVFSRKGEDWVAEVVLAHGVLDLPEVGLSIPLQELYADVGLTEGPAAETAED